MKAQYEVWHRQHGTVMLIFKDENRYHDLCQAAKQFVTEHPGSIIDMNLREGFNQVIFLFNILITKQGAIEICEAFNY